MLAVKQGRRHSVRRGGVLRPPVVAELVKGHRFDRCASVLAWSSPPGAREDGVPSRLEDTRPGLVVEVVEVRYVEAAQTSQRR